MSTSSPHRSPSPSVVVRPLFVAGSLLLAGGALLVPSVAQAVQPGSKPAPKPPQPSAKPGAAATESAPAATPAALTPEAIAQLRAELHSPDAGRALEAAQRLGEDPSPALTDVLLDELAVGAPTRVQAALLGGLGGRKDPRVVDVALYYARNRNPELRKKAVVLLGESSDPRTSPALIDALSDTLADVRLAAARALAARRERAATPALIKLLEHKDAAAVEPLAAVAGPEVARELGELLGTVPDPLLARTMGLLLARPDFGPDPIRVEVVKLLVKIPGSDAHDALTDYIAATASDKLRPSRIAAEKALVERGGK